jgi:ApbE superfamily uncharacterized protein (UPF0280 family)
VKETDLHVSARTNLRSKAYRLILKYREKLESYIGEHPSFLTSLKPVAVDVDSPNIIRAMAESAAMVGVGPMAAVAGAVADFVGRELLAFSPEVVIENGGDIYLKSQKTRRVAIYAGSSPLSGKIGLEIRGSDTPLGVATSSGTVGHSLSFGRADAVTILAKYAALADAAATATGNLVASAEDINTGIEFARHIPEVSGGLIIVGDKMGVWGKVRLSRAFTRQAEKE